MGVRTLTRLFLLSTVAAILASTAYADTPSARANARIVYDPVTTRTVLFGGETEYDSGTKSVYDLGDTWEWNGLAWIRRYPAVSPPARSEFAMLYDSNRSHVLIFGGKNGTNSYLSDTWFYRDETWQKIDTPSAPTARRFPGAAFDPIRDRVVLFGGSFSVQDPKLVTPTITNLYDTWEFDGTTWTRRSEAGPTLVSPTLAYDETRNEVVMLGEDDKGATKMFRWNGGSGAWEPVTPTTLPACVGGAAMTWEPTDQAVLFTGGLCANGTITDSTYEWDGTDWTALTILSSQGGVFSHAMTWDRLRNNAVLFGGASSVNLYRSTTYLFTALLWLPAGASSSPAPRSLAVFERDPVRNVIWMYGGVNESQTFTDFWKYANGRWEAVTIPDGGPLSCVNPVGTFDTDRQKLVMVCQNSDVWEYDGTDWKTFAAAPMKNKPTGRRLSSLVYDAKLKKTVLFGGGFDVSTTSFTYLDETWLWDGASWNRVKNNPPTSRALASMWFDPIQQKTVMYGGIGRITSTDRITRYDDMWSFDGTGWAAMNVKPTPGIRYGAPVAIDPSTGRAIIYGGLRVDTINSLPAQVYAGDQWEWDGTKWSQLLYRTMPPTRENGQLEFDPVTGKLVLFGGFAGTYFSDIWILGADGWRVTTTNVGRRRAAGTPPVGSSSVTRPLDSSTNGNVPLD